MFLLQPCKHFEPYNCCKYLHARPLYLSESMGQCMSNGRYLATDQIMHKPATILITCEVEVVQAESIDVVIFLQFQRELKLRDSFWELVSLL